jgi:hypothetical protein
MSETNHPESPPLRHEERDIDVRSVYAVGGALVVVAVVVHLAAWWIFDALNKSEREDKRSAFPLAAKESGGLPPEPRLQEINRLAGNAGPLYAAEQRRLETYGWVDEKESIVHIPIDRAMKLIVEEKRLPSRPPAEKAEGRQPR